MIRRLWKPIKHALILGLLWLVDRLLRALPLGLARGLGERLGRVFYAWVPYERKKTLATLATAFPESSPAWREQTGAAVFGHLGRSGAEFFRMADMGPDDIDAWVGQVTGWEHAQAELVQGRGIVFVTAHYGHWELLAAWTARRAPVGVVARQIYDARLDQVLIDRRHQHGVEVFSRNTAVRPILRWLKDGKVLGTLADQDTGVDSLYVDFFGHPAKTPSGPAVLAQATGAALLTAWCTRREDGRYDLAFGRPIPVPPRGQGGPMELWPVVQEYTRQTEAAVRRAPQLWAFNHARWRSGIRQASTGWDPRLADACLQQCAAWAAAGRPPLAGA
jgi:KDO2-lipid IV(A) lauroyltransferase